MYCCYNQGVMCVVFFLLFQMLIITRTDTQTLHYKGEQIEAVPVWQWLMEGEG